MRKRLPTIALFLALTTLAPPLAGADPPAHVARPRAPQTRAHRRKIQGAVLMALGIAHLAIATITGFYWLGEERSCQADPSCRDEDIATPIAALTTVALGGIFSAVGVPVYVSGANGVARQPATAQAPLLTVAF